MISMFQQEDRGVVARALLRSFTSEIKKLWLPTLDRLAKSQARERGTSVCSGMMYGAWLKFGNTVGLNEGEERKRMEVEKDGDNARKELPGPPYCYWKECGFHEKKPPRATSLCSGCGSVQYCDQKCQTRSVSYPIQCIECSP
ncbi:hypothetical protein OF83DRAFT_441874 [Amylostereum chailletii]|nr:hypothetical protein OF83DRAFT_441874 [Amylostereum chailletii]